ncbi:MAG: AAA family ATPase [Candidatus Scatovivens sp.]
MNNIKFLNNIYDDFFGIEKLKIENEINSNDLNNLDNNELKKTKEISNSKEDTDRKMINIFERIDDLYITDDSKNILKKIIEYMRKYNEKIEKEYIQFNMCFYLKDDETINKLLNILEEAIDLFNYLKKSKNKNISVYDINKVEDLEKEYQEEFGIITLKNLNALNSKEQSFKDEFWNKIDNYYEENENAKITILLENSIEILSQVFDKNEKIKNKIFELEIKELKPNICDMYQEVIEKLKENNEVSDEFSIVLLEYISATYPNTEYSFSDYRDKLYKEIIFNKKEKLDIANIPEYEKEKTMEQIFEELNELVGLKNVKQVLQDLVSLIELKNKTKDTLKLKDTNLHMVFLGNPGTGKTTVARLISQILYNLKYTKQNKLIEVSSKDLVGEYVGQTGPKTMGVIEKAMGGVLFIDEAYSLASGHGQGNSYNEEAIATLIQAMENYRDNLVVIFAGYTKEMQDFLNANSGIVSRIGYTLEFEDYTEEELLKIFESMTQKAGFEVTDEAKEKVLEIIKEYKGTKNFGNARFVRNLYEKTVIKHATNTRNKKSKKILRTIVKEDISSENILKM